MQKSMLSVAGVLVLGVMVVLINSIGNNLFSRFYIDLTEENLYTLSDGSKHILADLKEPISIKYYLSKTDGAQYPAVKMYGDRVLNLLREFQRNSRGLITLETYDPRPDSDEEGWAQKYGITPLAMPNGEQLYFGMVALNSEGREEAIPVFNLARQEFLEYDVTKLIYSLSLDKKPLVGIITSLNMKGESQSPMMMGRRPEGQEPWVLVNQISNVGETNFLATDVKEIPKDIKELLVIHPKTLSEPTRYAIDQFVMRGGNLVVAIDPYCNADQPAQDPSNPTAAMFADKSSSLKELLSPWGVEMLQSKVVGDISLATKVNTGDGGPPRDFVFWMSLTGKSGSNVPAINRENLLTSQLDNLLFAWAGSLDVKPVDGISVETLFRTTNDAQLFDEADYRYGGGNPDGLLSKYVRGSEPQTLGVKLSGKFKSTFKAKPEGAEGEYLPEAKEGAHVVVVSDVDFLTDQTSAAVQRFLGTKLVSLLNDNLVFAANLVENMLGSNDLISLRSRGQFTRPFTKVQEIEQRAQEKWRLEETSLQAKLQSATDRLNQLQSAAGVGDKKRGEAQVLTKDMLDEVKRFREERADAQARLRDVRRNLRQDKERLGSWLFILNTFFVPLLLIVGYVLWQRRPLAK